MVTELGIAQFVDMAETVTRLDRAAVYGKPLETTLGEKLFKSLAEALMVRPEQIADLQSMHPRTAAQLLLRAKCPGIAQEGLPMEGRLLLAAQDRGLPILALESGEQQYGAIPKITSKIWIAYVANAVRFAERADCSLAMKLMQNQIMQAADTGDATALLDAARAGYAELDYEEFDRHFIGSRNQHLAANAIAILGKKRFPLFAIGAGHLHGKDGVLDRLKAAGFEWAVLVVK